MILYTRITLYVSANPSHVLAVTISVYGKWASSPKVRKHIVCWPDVNDFLDYLKPVSVSLCRNFFCADHEIFLSSFTSWGWLVSECRHQTNGSNQSTKVSTTLQGTSKSEQALQKHRKGLMCWWRTWVSDGGGKLVILLAMSAGKGTFRNNLRHTKTTLCVQSGDDVCEILKVSKLWWHAFGERLYTVSAYQISQGLKFWTRDGSEIWLDHYYCDLLLITDYSHQTQTKYGTYQSIYLQESQSTNLGIRSVASLCKTTQR